MRLTKVGVVTITLARNVAEERTLSSALAVLRDCELPVIAAHGGGGAKFVHTVQGLGFEVVVPKERGLVKQVKAGLAAALKMWPTKAILYTEPDKYPFFRDPLTRFVDAVRQADVAIAARDARSFRTFSKGQQWTEAFTNEAAEISFGLKADYCYGPLLLSRRAAEMALEAPDELGWGWRFWLMARVKREGMKLKAVTLNLPCPKEQRGEDRRADRIYRLKQLRQNLTGMELGMGQ
ncbi:MAG: hypothetical protein ACXW32_08595 [Limisphaerales bacterium]